MGSSKEKSNMWGFSLHLFELHIILPKGDTNLKPFTISATPNQKIQKAIWKYIRNTWISKLNKNQSLI